eukprot:m.145595 g.145595  ORF g.145595 m.145595 type:complete len:317 (+) comp11629_c1_seq5:67-1017(+)
MFFISMTFWKCALIKHIDTKHKDCTLLTALSSLCDFFLQECSLNRTRWGGVRSGVTVGLLSKAWNRSHREASTRAPRAVGKQLGLENVRVLAMLGLVQATHTGNGHIVHTEAVQLGQDAKDHKHVGGSPPNNDKQAKERPAKTHPRSTVVRIVKDTTHAVLVKGSFLVHSKEGDGDDAPRAGAEVHSHGVNRVIDTGALHRKRPALVRNATNETNYPRGPRVHRVGTGANGNHPGNGPVAHLHQTPVAFAKDKVKEDRHQTTARGREHRVDNRQRHGDGRIEVIEGEDGTAVEAEKSEKQNHGSQSHHWHRVPVNL